MALSITPLTDAEIASITSSPRIQRWLRDLITQLRTLDATTSAISTDISDVTAVADSGAATGREAMVIALSLARLIGDLEHQPPAINYRQPAAYTFEYARSKADIGLQRVENTALSTWPGTTNITTLGTIATGTWQGSVIGYAYGGTGLSSVPANGQVDIGNGSGFTRATLTAGSGVSITNGAGTITISATGSGGTVTTISVVSANGLAGSVANPTTTPAITLSTTVTGILKGNGTAISAATAGTDYLTVLSGDATTSGNVITFAAVNSSVGSFGSSTSIPTFTVNGKGLITAASGNAVVAPAGTLTGATLAAGVTASSLTSCGASMTLSGGLELGYRNIPISSNTGTWTLASVHRGLCIMQTDAATATVDGSVVAAGGWVAIYNNSASNMTIAQGSGITLRLPGTATTGSRTIAQRGLATVYFTSSSEALVYGQGVT